MISEYLFFLGACILLAGIMNAEDILPKPQKCSMLFFNLLFVFCYDGFCAIALGAYRPFLLGALVFLGSLFFVVAARGWTELGVAACNEIPRRNAIERLTLGCSGIVFCILSAISVFFI